MHDGNCESQRSARDKVLAVRLGTPPPPERIHTLRSHSWHYCILAGSQGDAPSLKSGWGHSGRTRKQRKTHKNTSRTFFACFGRSVCLCCWHDWEEFSHQLSYLLVKHSATSQLNHPCHCTTHREGLSSCTKTLPDSQRDALNMPTTTAGSTEKTSGVAKKTPKPFTSHKKKNKGFIIHNSSGKCRECHVQSQKSSYFEVYSSWKSTAGYIKFQKWAIITTNYRWTKPF